MIKKTLAVTGLSGVLGTYLAPLLTQKYNVIELYNSKPSNNAGISANIPLNLIDSKTIKRTLAALKPDYLLHLAAITHIDACEQDKFHGKDGIVWKVNVEATQEIAEYGAANDCQVIMMSTEAVFDGNQDSYNEASITRPVSWYGTSKAVAELALQQASPQHSIIRAVISYYPDNNPATLYGSLLASLKTKHTFGVVDDHFITPTYIPDINDAVDAIIARHKAGIFHVTPNQITTPYEFAQTMATFLGYDVKLIQPRSLTTFLDEDRARLRVKHACLDSKQTQMLLDVTPKNLSEVLTLL